MRVTTKIFNDAILSLRIRLGETQESMARRLGSSVSGYIKWERGVSKPRGEWLMKILQLCPDEETRAAFGIGPLPSAPPTYNKDARAEKLKERPAAADLKEEGDDLTDRSPVPEVLPDGRTAVKYKYPAKRPGSPRR